MRRGILGLVDPKLGNLVFSSFAIFNFYLSFPKALKKLC